MKLGITRETILPAEDHTWLGSAHGTQTADPITLDATLFDLDPSTGDFPDGFIPSGVVLGKVTATDKYGPYGGNVNEVQIVTVDATSGTFTLTFDGETTAAIAEAATASAVQSALEALSNINPGDVAVSGSAGGPWTVTFTGQYKGLGVPEMTGTDVNLAGGGDSITVTTSVQGGSGASNGLEVALGHLFTTVSAVDGDTDIGAALYWHGEVVEDNLPDGHGLDDAAKAALPQIRYV